MTDSHNSSKIESVLIGSILFTGLRAMSACVAQGVNANWFGNKDNVAIYNDMLEMFIANKHFDLAIISRQQPELSEYIDHCVDSCITPSQYASYVDELRHDVILRRMNETMLTTSDRVKNASIQDVNSVLEEIQDGWLSIGKELITCDVATDEAILTKIITDWNNPKDDSASVITWPIQIINDILGRLTDELVYIVARESVGKTAFALQMLCSLWDRGIVASMASMESSREKMFKRMIAHIAQVNTFELNNGIMRPTSPAKITNARQRIGSWKGMRIIDTGMNMNQVRAWAMQEKQRGSMLLVIDNMKHIRPTRKFSSTTEMFREHSMELKWLRDDTGLPIIVLHHLNKEGDLSWSDDLRRDADIILSLSDNEELSVTPKPPADLFGYSVIRFRTLKHRDGYKNCELDFEYDKQYQTFKNYYEHKQKGTV